MKLLERLCGWWKQRKGNLEGCKGVYRRNTPLSKISEIKDGTVCN